jgi:hypothetical protein
MKYLCVSYNFIHIYIEEREIIRLRQNQFPLHRMVLACETLLIIIYHRRWCWILHCSTEYTITMPT